MTRGVDSHPRRSLTRFLLGFNFNLRESSNFTANADFPAGGAILILRGDEQQKGQSTPVSLLSLLLLGCSGKK